MRFLNSIKNFLVGIGGQIFSLSLGILSRNIFLCFLTIEYLGASGLFSSILTMLSLAELGFGSAIIYSLYKPLAEKNEREILAIMQFFKKVYRIIAGVVFVAGMCCLPFLNIIVGEGGENIEHLPWIYILFVINTSASYLFSYNATLITADQKAYKLASIQYISKLLTVVFPLIGLALTKQYLVYLSVQIMCTIGANLIIYARVNKEYPIIKTKEKLLIPENIKKTIIKNVMALSIYKVAIVVTAGTDNILISMIFGIATVGVYSNYTLIVQSIVSFVSQGMNAIVSSIGNLNVTEKTEQKLKIFYSVQLINFWLYGFAASGLYFCINPLIHVWLPNVDVFDMSVVLPLAISFFLLGMQGSVSIFRDAQGLFWQGKLRPIAQTVINLGFSILLSKLTGSVAGIVWGTVLSRLLVNFWFDPYVVFKHGFKRPLFPYFKRYAAFLCIEMLTCGLTWLVIQFNPFHNSWLILIYDMVVCTVITNAIFFVCFRKMSEFKYLKEKIVLLLHRKKINTTG